MFLLLISDDQFRLVLLVGFLHQLLRINNANTPREIQRAFVLSNMEVQRDGQKLGNSNASVANVQN